MRYVKYLLVEIDGRIVTPPISGLDGGYFYDGTWRYGTCDDNAKFSENIIEISAKEYNDRYNNSNKYYGVSLLDELERAFPALSTDIETLKNKSELTPEVIL